MLKTIGTIDTDSSIGGTGKNDWRSLGELDNSLRGFDRLAIGILIVLKEDWIQGIFLEIPNLDTTIVRDGGEDRGGIGRPADIINLLLQVADLVAEKLAFRVFLVPDTNSPIIGASDEDWTVIGVPEGITSDTIDWSHMAVVVEGVTLREGC